MDFIKAFLWLGLMAGYNAFFLWPAAVLLPLAVVFLALSWKNWRPSTHRTSLALLLLPLIGSVLILLCGAIFQSEMHWSQTDQIVVSDATVLMSAALMIELGLAAWVFLRLPKLKMVTLVLGLLQCCYAVMCYGMAYMYVTNNWM
jgi:hypothetical protein